MFHQWVLGRMKLKNETEARLEEGRKDCRAGDVRRPRAKTEGKARSGLPGGGGGRPAAAEAAPGEQRQLCTQGLLQGWNADRPECQERQLKPLQQNGVSIHCEVGEWHSEKD